MPISPESYADDIRSDLYQRNSSLTRLAKVQAWETPRLDATVKKIKDLALLFKPATSTPSKEIVKLIDEAFKSNKSSVAAAKELRKLAEAAEKEQLDVLLELTKLRKYLK